MRHRPAPEPERITPRTSLPLLLALLVLAPAGISGITAADEPEKSPWDLKLFRFEFDNDNFIGSDDAFSAGWSFQVHSRLMDEWNPAFAGWIGKFPSLGDDGEGRRIVRWAYSISQVIVTPADISIAAPQPNDVPWAGTLGVTAGWYSYNNRRLGALQVYLGCMGPCSYAEQVQRFIHEDLGFGDPPQGWDNQLSTRFLANLNYEYRYKLYSPAVSHYMPSRFAGDFSVASEAAVGNRTTRLIVGLEARFGWGLTMGFTKNPDPPGIGIVLDPVYFDPEELEPALQALKRWRIYFNLMARRHWITYLTAAEGGPTESGYNHPPLRPYPGEKELMFGMHLIRVPFGFNLSFYRYMGALPEGVSSTPDWVNFSFEYRF